MRIENVEIVQTTVLDFELWLDGKVIYSSTSFAEVLRMAKATNKKLNRHFPWRVYTFVNLYSDFPQIMESRKK
jgi:hypothetical protein